MAEQRRQCQAELWKDALIGQLMYTCMGRKSALPAAIGHAWSRAYGLDRYISLADVVSAYANIPIETRAACADHYGAGRYQQHVTATSRERYIMKPFPHRYAASARARAIGRVVISAPAVTSTDTAPRLEFDGPGGTWSPEMVLCAAVADCFVLTFRGAARAAHFNWIALDCHVEGVLEHIENATHFTRFAMTARLTLPPGADEARARLLLGKAEHGCLIANSLRGERTFSMEIVSTKTESESSARLAASGNEAIGRRGASRERQAEAQPLR